MGSEELFYEILVSLNKAHCLYIINLLDACDSIIDLNSPSWEALDFGNADLE